MFDVYNEREYEIFDDVIIEQDIRTQFGEFQLSRDYFGGIDEFGNEDLRCSGGCAISFCGINGTYPEKKIIEILIYMLECDGEEVEKTEDGLTLYDYVSYDSTEETISKIVAYFGNG